MRTPNDKTSNEYKEVYQSYSNIQLVNITLGLIIQENKNTFFEEIYEKINNISNSELSFLQVHLKAIGVSFQDSKYDFDRSLYSDYKKIGFNTMQDYMHWYIQCRELVELYDLLEIYVEKIYNRQNKKRNLNERKVFLLLPEIVDINLIQDYMFGGMENSINILLKYCYYCRNQITHKNGIIDSKFKCDIGALKPEKDFFNENFDILYKDISNSMDKFTKKKFDIFPKTNQIGKVVSFRETFINIIRNLFICTFEFIEYDYLKQNGT